MQELLSAFVNGILVATAFVGLGFAVLQVMRSYDEIRIAKGCFLVAAVGLGGHVFMWGIRTPERFLFRTGACVLIFGVVGALAVEGFRYLNRKATIVQPAHKRFPEMVHVSGDRFLMGSPDGEAGQKSNERPQHCVTVQSFQMGKYEVTQGQWQYVAGLPKVRIDLNPDPSNFKGINLPVDSVTWEQAVEFCERLCMATGKHYRLPTEAEWEYACRAGTEGPYAGNLDDMAWYGDNAGGTSHPVTARRQSNKFELYNMHGNVWEWCLDTWHDNYDGAPTDGSAWQEDGERDRVARGGSWHGGETDCRSAMRMRLTQDTTDVDYGFRVVLAEP